MTKVRKRHNAEFKSKVAVEAIKEHKTLNELTTEYGVHATQMALLQSLSSRYAKLTISLLRSVW